MRRPALIAGWLGLSILGLTFYLIQEQPEREKSQPDAKRLLPDITRADIARLELQFPGGGVVLVWERGAWHLPQWQGYRAEPVFSEMLVNTLLSAPAGMVMTKNPEKYWRYDLVDPPRTVTV